MSPTIRQVIQDFAARKLQVLPETANEQWSEEKKLIQRYAERELFELVQNALDRARERVVLRLNQDGSVFVGNDGQPVTVLEQEGQHYPRNDFEGLLSVNTSRKKAWEAIGNKGVGFKSVFGASTAAEVWSRHPTQGWWGFRLRHPFEPEHARTEQVAKYVENLPQRAAPSFYFPEPLDRPTWLDDPWVVDHGLVTVIHLSEPTRDLAAPFKEFRGQQLYFVAARYPHKSDLQIIQQAPGAAPASRGIDLPATWLRHPAQPRDMDDPRLRELADDAGLAFKWDGDTPVPPRIQLAFPPAEEAPTGLFWSFLPTRHACPFPVQIHADFLLTDDRTRLQDRSAYNAHLLRHVPKLLDQAQGMVLADRADRWTFLTPAHQADDPLVEAAKAHFVDGGRLVELALACFGTADQPVPQPRAVYQGFWRCVESWSRCLIQAGQWDQTRLSRLESQLLAPLRRARVACVPIAVHPDAPDPLTGVPIPSQPNRLFLRVRRKDREPTENPVPAWLSAQGIQVTWWLPDAAKSLDDPLQISNFVWRDLARAIRTALHPDTARRTFDPTNTEFINELSEDQHRELLRFSLTAIDDAAEGLANAGVSLVLWSWPHRLKRAAEDQAARARDYAMLPLPVLGGGWLPAIRCSLTRSPALQALSIQSRVWGVVDTDRLPPGDWNEVLRQLGVWPSLPMRLEGRRAHFVQAPWTLDEPARLALLDDLGDHNEDCYGRPLRERLNPTLRERAWIGIQAALSPADTWCLDAKDQSDVAPLPTVREGEYAPWLLEALGVLMLTRGDADAKTTAKARASLATLAKLAAEPSARDQGTHRRLAQRLARMIDPDLVSDFEPVHVLVVQGQALRWQRLPAPDAPPIYQASRTSTRWVSRFTDLPMAVLDVRGPRWTAVAGVQAFDPTVVACPPPDTLQQDPAIKEALRAHLAVVLAVAEQRSLGPGRLFVLEEVVARWSAATVLRGPNVYLSIRQSGAQEVTEGKVDPDTGKPVVGDVYFTPSAPGKGPAPVLHDVPDQPGELGWSRQDPSRYLPRFAGWFANEVLRCGTQGVGLIGHVLGLGAAALKRDLARLVHHDVGVPPQRIQEIEARLPELLRDEAQREALRALIREALRPFGEPAGTELLRLPLTPACFGTVNEPNATQAQIQARLEQTLGQEHPAQFDCTRHNQERWKHAKQRLRDTVLLQVIAARRASFDHTAHQALLQSWEDLEPSAAWLEQLRPDPLEPMRAAFRLTSLQDEEPSQDPQLVDLLAGRPWSTPTSPAKVTVKARANPGPGSGQVQTSQDRNSSDQGKQRRGALAEQACARQEAARLRPRLQDPHLRNTLDAERRAMGDQRAWDWDTALQDDTALATLLRLSGPGGVDCGYDVVSLDRAGEIQRIEVKSATSTGRVFLTRNELARCEEAPERYRLFLYVGLKQAHDLSQTLRELVRRADLTHARRTLERALPPSGYELHFSIQPNQDSSDR